MFSHKRQGDDRERKIMSETTTSEELLLYTFRNKYKFYFAEFLRSSLFAISRLSSIPFLMVLAFELNMISIPVFLFYLYQARRIEVFLERLTALLYIYTAYFGLNTIHLYIDNALREGSINSIRYMKLVDKPHAEHAFPSLKCFIPFIRPIKSNIFIINSLWYSVIFVGFGFTLVLTWYTLLYLFMIRYKKEDIFHFYL